jgi:hypothetical protein
MPEYEDVNIMKWMNTYYQVYQIVGDWNNANLLSGIRPLPHMKEILNNAGEIPENLRDEDLRRKISILEEAVKIAEDKDKRLNTGSQ